MACIIVTHRKICSFKRLPLCLRWKLAPAPSELCKSDLPWANWKHKLTVISFPDSNENLQWKLNCNHRRENALDFFAEFKFVKIMMCYIWQMIQHWEWNSKPCLVWTVPLKLARGYSILYPFEFKSGCVTFCQLLRTLSFKSCFEHTVHVYFYKCRKMLRVVKLYDCCLFFFLL